MKLYLQDTLISWLRQHPAFAKQNRFELLVADLARELERGLVDLVREQVAEQLAEAEADREYEAEMKSAAAKKSKRKAA
jgi:uncharacterized protein YigA (DUF484 family)